MRTNPLDYYSATYDVLVATYREEQSPTAYIAARFKHEHDAVTFARTIKDKEVIVRPPSHTVTDVIEYLHALVSGFYSEIEITNE